MAKKNETYEEIVKRNIYEQTYEVSNPNNPYKHPLHGFIFKAVSTEVAKNEVKNSTCEGERGDWWLVATMESGEDMWMDNMNGCLLIITKGDTSYMRYL